MSMYTPHTPKISIHFGNYRPDSNKNNNESELIVYLVFGKYVKNENENKNITYRANVCLCIFVYFRNVNVYIKRFDSFYSTV